MGFARMEELEGMLADAALAFERISRERYSC